MAKNAVDAHRKQQRKKELAKNKQLRVKAKEIAIVKKDTRSIEADIQRLQSSGQLSAADKDELSSLRAELARVNKAKNEYVEKHPEHRKFVFPERATTNSASSSHDPPGLFTKDGKLKNPERSIYYDPVFNPYGAPPPGMPYRERPRTPPPPEFATQQSLDDDAEGPDSADDDDDEGADDAEDDNEDDDDDIPMPEGPPPPPADSDEDSDDSDDIPMPEGPPPPHARLNGGVNRVNIARPPTSYRPPRPQQHYPQPFHPDPRMRQPFPQQQHFRPPPRSVHPLPMRPGGPSQIQDPLSDAPQQTYQAMQHARQFGAPAVHPPGSAPPPPPPPIATAGPFISAGGASAAGANATISAAPVLRDLKAEATAFLPTHLRKKRAAAQAAAAAAPAAVAGLGKIDATRGADTSTSNRPSLMGALKDKGIGDSTVNADTAPPTKKKESRGAADYAQFELDMQEFL